MFVLIVASITGLAPASAGADTLNPTRSFSLRATVAVRETIAAAIAADSRLHVLITDQAPTGRSAILLDTETDGSNQQWVDLKVPAHSLVRAGSFSVALAPAMNGLRILQPAGGLVRSTDFAGITAQAVGTESQFIRLLATGDLAVHDVVRTSIGPARILSTSPELKIQQACATCATEKMVAQGAYVVSVLPQNRIAVTHRSLAHLKIIDLSTGKVLSSAVLDNEDVRRGRAMFARQQEAAVNMRVNPSNPSIIVAGAAHSSGDMFFLVGPFTPAEGARVIRVSSGSGLVSSIRYAYPRFDPEQGPPRFLAVEQDHVYLISSKGHVNVYPISSTVSANRR
ncbi:MAG: hypothetical protein IT168_22895 [Bryobacterales bacterium]|nr:hypothetical protein [Bryobacterales bacterium]